EMGFVYNYALNVNFCLPGCWVNRLSILVKNVVSGTNLNSHECGISLLTWFLGLNYLSCCITRWVYAALLV
ncbi:MAG: hypothetical protein ABFR65_13210, partial [Pseudomonadota bacterium]